MTAPPEPWVSSSGLVVVDLIEPEGPRASVGDTVSTHYELSLDDGRVIDSSRSRGLPIEFTIGQGRVVLGLEEAVTGMVLGGIRQVLVPSELGYGEVGIPGMIPPNAELSFVIELMDITPAATN